MALQERTRSGLGQFIDMTLYDCALALLHPHAANYALSGKVPEATGNAHPNISPYDTFRTGSVDIFIGAGNDAAFAKLCDLLQAPELAADQRFGRNSDRVTQRAALKVELESRLMRVEGVAFCEKLLAAGVPAGAIQDIAGALAHPHTVHRGMFLQQDGCGMTGTPLKFSRTPGNLQGRPPHYGEHTREVLLELGLGADELQRLLDAGVVLKQRRQR
jgi:crotonobetainyl-CoA:carnitine CoA-transferase CaiB-like acyl-CoA transferase